MVRQSWIDGPRLSRAVLGPDRVGDDPAQSTRQLMVDAVLADHIKCGLPSARRETWNWLRLITRTDPASISQERT